MKLLAEERTKLEKYGVVMVIYYIMHDFEDNIIILDDTENEILKDITTRFSYNPAKEPELFCQEAKELSDLLPEKIKQRLVDFAKNGNNFN